MIHSSTLKEIMYHSDVPPRKCAEILRVKERVSGVDIEEGCKFQISMDDNKINVEEGVMFKDANDSSISQNSSIGLHDNVGLSYAYFNLLPERTPED